MKTALQFSLLLLLSGHVFGQHRGAPIGGGSRGFVGGGFRSGVRHGGFVGWGMPFRTYRSPHGFGNIVFPGAGTAPRLRRPFSFYRRPFGFYYSYGVYRRWPYRPWGLWGYPWAVPVTFPVFVGGYGYPVYPYPPAPSVIVIYQGRNPENDPPEVQGEKQTPAQSGRVRYEPPSRPAVEPWPTADKTSIYHIAFNDRSVVVVVAHWLEQDTLHYVTSQGAHKLVPLDSVDRVLSEQLNRERKVEIRWPWGQEIPDPVPDSSWTAPRSWLCGQPTRRLGCSTISTLLPEDRPVAPSDVRRTMWTEKPGPKPSE